MGRKAFKPGSQLQKNLRALQDICWPFSDQSFLRGLEKVAQFQRDMILSFHVHLAFLTLREGTWSRNPENCDDLTPWDALRETKSYEDPSHSEGGVDWDRIFFFWGGGRRFGLRIVSNTLEWRKKSLPFWVIMYKNKATDALATLSNSTISFYVKSSKCWKG